MLISGACGGGGGGSGDGEALERTVFVDWASDEFASFYLFNFPEKVAVRQGDTVVFKQTWTGEPHTVTGGVAVSAGIEAGESWFTFFDAFESLARSGAALPNPDDPGDATVADFAEAVNTAEATKERDALITAWNALRSQGASLPDLANPPADMTFMQLVELVDTESEEALGGLPQAFNEDDNIAQNVGQPCFLDEGSPPEDPDEPCARADQKQPEFTGRQTYFNSGIIPYEGSEGNTFEMKIAENAEVGTYSFYCAVHGFTQRTDVEVRPRGAEVPSRDAVVRQTRSEIEKLTEPMRKTFEDASDDNRITFDGPEGKTELQGPFAGLPGEGHTAINEFVPKTIKAKAGEPITWKMLGADHTISFNVPKYFPIMEFLKDGTVRINPKLPPAAGGAVGVKDEEDESGGPVQHDGGTFDGTGFWSSGLIGAEPYLEYTMRISKKGTYTYACLLHPPMVGKIEVT